MRSRSTPWRPFAVERRANRRAAHPGKAQRGDPLARLAAGKIILADRKVRVKRPRLRHKTEGEVKFPPTRTCARTAASASICWER